MLQIEVVGLSVNEFYILVFSSNGASVWITLNRYEAFRPTAFIVVT